MIEMEEVRKNHYSIPVFHLELGSNPKDVEQIIHMLFPFNLMYSLFSMLTAVCRSCHRNVVHQSRLPYYFKLCLSTIAASSSDRKEGSAGNCEG